MSYLIVLAVSFVGGAFVMYRLLVNKRVQTLVNPPVVPPVV